MPDATPTAFVAGATGLTGREVVRALREGGARVVAHVRPDSPRLEHWRAHFAALGAEVDTTPWAPQALTATLATLRPDWVFALLGTTRRRMRREGGDYATVDYGLTRMLIDAAVASGARPRFVYLSAVGVSARSKGAYYAARWRAEEDLRQSGLPYAIARPSFIVGDRDEGRPMERVGASLADGALAVVGLLGGRSVAERYRSRQAPALARALVRLAAAPGGDAVAADGFDLFTENR